MSRIRKVLRMYFGKEYRVEEKEDIQRTFKWSSGEKCVEKLGEIILNSNGQRIINFCFVNSL